MKQEPDENFSGARNAGRPLLLEGGLDWKALSLSPKDMDFVEAKASAAREIALAFGIPPLVLGLPGDNTFSNYQEANRAFWRQAVIPLVKRTQQGFASWLQPAWGEVAIEADLDRIDALAGERETEWRRIGAVRHKRQAIYDRHYESDCRAGRSSPSRAFSMGDRGIRSAALDIEGTGVGEPPL